MSLSICAISGKPLQHPVLSIKTGHLYEKEVIEKHLSSFPYCPLTNQPMQITDLIDIVRIIDFIQQTRVTTSVWTSLLAVI